MSFIQGHYKLDLKVKLQTSRINELKPFPHPLHQPRNVISKVRINGNVVNKIYKYI